MVEFNSIKEFNHQSIKSLHDQEAPKILNYELYGNENYEALENKFIANYQFKNIQSENGLQKKECPPLKPIDLS